ncbi:MAG: hypothetical protein LBM12_01565 [Candidatus Nomurabacteria bacterium]|jgi:hypothetical protein|nr:hypothetical protein [Candidatus Nomurabacteria bacterium]
MKQTTTIKTAKNALLELAFAFASVAMALLIGTSVSADGPSFGPVGASRPTYTVEHPAAVATWNSITDRTNLPAVANGDERNFVWVREYGVGEYQDQLAVKGDKQYEVMMYYHNNAGSNMNNADPEHAIMFRARAKASFPAELAAQEVGIIRGELEADNATAVWDEAWIISDEEITLEYVAGSAKLYNNSTKMSNPTGSGRILPSSLFSTAGTLIGWHDLDGVLPGCTQYSGWIRYVIQTDTVEAPVPEPTPEPEEPEELPTTGPVEVVGALVGGTVLTVAIVYYVRSRQTLGKTI